MSNESFHSSDVIPSACLFFRETFDDPMLTDHDLKIIVEHAKECTECAESFGNAINTKAKDI